MRSAEELKRDITFEAVLKGHRLRFCTTWGLFSPRGIDEGSELLLRFLDVAEAGATLDLGCGYGALGLAVAAANPEAPVVLVDKDVVAVDYARKNAELNGLDNCQVLLSNGLEQVPQEHRFDTVVANLPANVGRELLFILLSDAYERLEPGGQVVVVTVNGLRMFIKRNLLEIFGSYRKLKQGRTHTVASACRAASS